LILHYAQDGKMDQEWACKKVQFSDTISAAKHPDLLIKKEVQFTNNTSSKGIQEYFSKRETKY